MKSKLLLFVYLLSIVIIINGCSSNEDNPVTPDNDDQNGTNKWTIESIVTNSTYPALVISNDNVPHISFLDNNIGYIKYAYRNGDTWVVQSVGKASNANGTIANGGISSIALDVANKPYITYYDYGNVQFKLASITSGNWNLVPILLPDDPLMSYASPFIPWAESSVVIDKNTGTVHVALQMLGGWSGYVPAYWQTGLPTAIIVDGEDTNSGYQIAIALNSDGYPSITYEARGSGMLKYAHWTGTTFEKESLSSMPQMYWMEHLTSVIIDSDDMPHIAYYGNGSYKYAYKNASGWTTKELNYQSGYPALSISLDSKNSPHIALVTVDTGNAYRLKHAYLNGTQWEYDNIEDNINHCCIAVDQSDKIHVVYETDAGELKYAFK